LNAVLQHLTLETTAANNFFKIQHKKDDDDDGDTDNHDDDDDDDDNNNNNNNNKLAVLVKSVHSAHQTRTVHTIVIQLRKQQYTQHHDPSTYLTTSEAIKSPP
jgi:hypothetical protein